MDRRPIGVFDSGLGGLTTVRQLMEQLPGEDIIYFGDTSRVPYGTRSRETILKYAAQDVRFLLGHDIKAVIIACNTADTTARHTLMEQYPIPMFGVVEPSARRAAAVTKNQRIGLIGTRATIGSGAYEALLAKLRPEAEVRAVACNLFVPLVENGRIRPGDPVIETVAAEYLQPLKDWGCDTLVLGCTHYPLLWEVIGNFMGPEVTLINSGREAAAAVAEELKKGGLLSDRTAGSCRYFVSDSASGFQETASLFLQREIRDAVTQIDIESF